MADFRSDLTGWSAPVSLHEVQFEGQPLPVSMEPLLEAAREAIPMPLVPSEEPLPMPTVVQLVRLPPERPERAPPTNFQILTPVGPPAASSSRSPSKDAAADGADGAPPAQEATVADQTRWIIEPQKEQRLFVKFNAEEVANFSTVLRFEIVGDLMGGPPPLTVSGVAALPGISSDPRLVFSRRKKRRPQDGYAIKSFVTSLGVYDFGPLLAGRDPASRQPTTDEATEATDQGVSSAPNGEPTDEEDNGEPQDATLKSAVSSFVMRHAEVVRIANTSLFPANVSLGLASAEDEEGKPRADAPFTPFLVEPASLALGVGQVAEVKVWCFPKEKGVFEDRLVARIEHNPEAVTFNLCAVGEVPSAFLDVDKVDFGRLMLNIRADDQRVRVKNTSALPVKWQMLCRDAKATDPEGAALPRNDVDPAEAANVVPDEFSVDPMDGTLAAGEERDVRLGFRSAQPGHFNFSMLLNVRDAEGLNEWQQAGSFAVQAEAFAVEAVVEPDPHETPLDFGTVLVNSSSTRTFDIVNCGRFTIRYSLSVRRALREFISLDQPADEIPKGEKRTITVTCMPTRLVEVPPERDGLVLQLFDTMSGETVAHKIPPIRVGVTAVYNSFQVTPPRGLNFGPVEKGEKQSRSFTVRNVGIFPFEWSLFDYADPPTIGEDGRPKDSPASLKAGPFSMSKASGKLEPDQEEEVVVNFEAVGDQDYDSKIAIWVDGVHGDEVGSSGFPGTSPYLLTGQSCIPGINTVDLQTIFEEQFVAWTLEDAIAVVGRPDVRVFCEADRVFSFGPVLAHGNKGGAQTTDEGPLADQGNGVTEFLRFSNPKAIPCEVRLVVKPKDEEAGRECPFEVEPTTLTIPAHDSQQVQVSFRPSQLGSFSAMLEASVPAGSDANTNHLEFELRGDGAVPSVSIQGPRLFGDEGGELRLGKLAVGRSHEVKMALRNDGLLPATVRVEVKKPSVHFTLACRPSVTLGRGEQRTFQVRFHPRAVGAWEADLSIRTLGNEAFEDVTIQLTGEGYSDEVSWDLTEVRRPAGPAGARSDEEPSLESEPPSPDDLQLGEVVVGSEVNINFQLTNSAAQPIRFEFPEEMPAPFGEQLRIEPRCGFVYPSSRHPMKLSFRPTEALCAEKVPLACKIATVSFDLEGEGLSPDTASEDLPFTAVEGTEKELPLHISGVADAGVVECETKEICFAPTVMFYSKVHRFTITNPSKISAPFEWRIVGKSAAVYSVTPMAASVPPEGEKEIEVRFSPVEVEDFGCELLCCQPGVAAADPALKIFLGGSALRPWCHIELVEGDYRNRRQADTPLDQKYRVVEIVSLGTNVKNTKRFYVYNPTAEAVDFMWMQEASTGGADVPGEQDTFRCLSRRGTILPGKKFEMSFEFAPESIETRESFWNFCLIGQKVVEYFLIAGTVTEPRVGTSLPCLNFGERLVESSVTEKVSLVNKEHLPFSFTIDKSSFQIEGMPEALHVSPMSGVIGPDSSIDLHVTFKPLQERAFNFNVVCNVKRKKEPIVLNVKGSGYKIHAALTVEEPAGRRSIYPGSPEPLDFGVLQVHEQRTVNLYLGNQSKKNFNFRIQVQQGNRKPRPLPDFDKPPYLAISMGIGDVRAHEEVMLELTYAPRDVHTLEGSTLQIVIPAGPVETMFQIALGGGAKRSRVDFSFLTYDFGPCFIAKDGATMAGEPLAASEDQRYEMVELVATNRDDSDCLISTTFTREPWLDVQLNAAMIEAGSSLRIPIIFSPRETCDYMQRLEFLVNDYTRMYVDIRGRGCPLRLELTSLEMQHVDFGVTIGGESVSKSVRLVNRSPRPVTFQLGDDDEELTRRSVFWSPSHPTTLRPRETCDVELRFLPTTRVAPFKVPLLARCEGGLDLKLLTVEGTCHATEMRLSEHSCFFGDVVVGSQSTRTVRLHNFGDLGAKFKFEMPARFGKIFSISPSEGFVRPQEEVSLTVAFHPTRDRVTDYKKAERAAAARRGKPMPTEPPGPLNVRLSAREIKCMFENHQPITLEATGVCVERTGETKTMSFSTEVRKEVKQSFEIENTQDVDWKLSPQVVTNEPSGTSFFTCLREIVVPARKKAEIEVTYLPFTMTEPPTGEDGHAVASPSGRPRCEKHRGTIFIGTPDGNAILYSLEGVALPPKVDKRLQERVPCKKQHNQRVPVKNWLHERQRFDVRVELVDPEPSSPDAQGINLQGVGTLDLPPGLERDYRFSIYSYHETAALVRVSLTSQQTGEFMVVEVEVEFYAPQSLATIKMEAACRQQVRHKIAVANPLSKPARFIGMSSNPCIRFAQELEVPARSERTLELLFRPVEEGEGSADVTLKSDELGVYPYTVNWRATPAGLERSLTMKAPLGGSATEHFKFAHMAKTAVTYTAKIEAAPGSKCSIADFMLEDSTVSAPALEENAMSKEMQVRLRYQPSSLGTKEQPSTTALLVISGPGGGEYKAMITGFAQPPQPQGPFDVPNGKTTAIEFRNPFEKPTEFTLQVDNPAFMVPMRSQVIDEQKTLQIQVSFKSDREQGGRLIISCKQVSQPWIFYLKGAM